MDPKSNLQPKVDHTNHEHPPLDGRAWPFRGALNRIARIMRLLLIGYPSEDAQLEHENQRHWEKLHETLLRKVENIGVVSGLLLASNANLLISSNGDLRRMTYTSVAASILGALVSLIFDLLCLWVLIGMHPSRLELLTKRSRLFYYMCGTPSLFGGASALAFFTAVGSWVWLDQVNQDRNNIAKVCAAVLGGALTLNTCVCFYLGGSMKGDQWVLAQDRGGQDSEAPVITPAEPPRGRESWSQISDVIVASEVPQEPDSGAV